MNAKYGHMATYTIDFVIKNPTEMNAHDMKKKIQEYVTISNQEEQNYFDKTFYFNDQQMK